MIQKWFDKIRFKNLPDKTDTNVLVVDSNGDMGINTSLGGDITAVTMTTDSGSGSAASVTAGNASFSILGSNGVGVTNLGATITAVAVPAEIDHDSLNNFDANEHFTQANITTVGTIDTGVWNGTSITTTYTDAKVTSIAAGDGIDVSSGTGDVTITAETASATNPGVVELATTDEADTGTDTDRAVTPEGLKSHVDLRFSYAYMTWSASAVSSVDGSDPEWVFPNTGKGIYEEDWNKDENIKTTSVGSTTYTVTRMSAVNGLVVPHDAKCMGFHAHGRNNDTSASFRAGLFHLEGSTTGTTNSSGVDYGNTGVTHEATLRWIATADQAEASGGTDGTSSTNYRGPCKLVSNVTAIDVSPGDVLLPAIMGPDASDEIFVTMTIILKVPLTT